MANTDILTYYKLSNTGCNDANKVNQNLSDLCDEIARTTLTELVSLTYANHALGTYTGPILLIECDATGGAFTVALPALASAEERLYIFKKIDTSANAVTVQAATGETIR